MQCGEYAGALPTYGTTCRMRTWQTATPPCPPPCLHSHRVPCAKRTTDQMPIHNQRLGGKTAGRCRSGRPVQQCDRGRRPRCVCPGGRGGALVGVGVRDSKIPLQVELEEDEDAASQTVGRGPRTWGRSVVARCKSLRGSSAPFVARAQEALQGQAARCVGRCGRRRSWWWWRRGGRRRWWWWRRRRG
jgi:hypothetical protein